MNTKKVWLVTGASKGLGLSLVKKLLEKGYQVAATSRSVNALIAHVGESINFLPLEVNLVDEDSVATAISKVVNTFGTLDVVVNNAGYGQLGTLEELTDAEARLNFDINVFGILNVIREAMPIMRRNKSGHVFNIASIGGFLGDFPGWGIYTGTKFAVAGITESFSAEARSFGVTATIVYPGYFRTDFLSKDSIRKATNKIAEYEEARELERIHEQEISGNQPGDPEKAADVLINVAENENPPLHLFLGSDAIGMAKGKLEALHRIIAETEQLGSSTDFLPI